MPKWSAENESALVRLWAKPELSCSDIGRSMGMTKNMIIGKSRRIGLSPRKPIAKVSTACVVKKDRPEPPISMTPAFDAGPKVPNAPAPIKRKPAKASPKPKPEVPAMVVAETPSLPPVAFLSDADAVVPMCRRVTIEELDQSMCRWPLGDPATPDFRYCGSPAPEGKPYCSHHSKLAYAGAPKVKPVTSGQYLGRPGDRKQSAIMGGLR